MILLQHYAGKCLIRLKAASLTIKVNKYSILLRISAFLKGNRNQSSGGNVHVGRSHIVEKNLESLCCYCITSQTREEDRREDVSHCPRLSPALAGLILCEHSRSAVDMVMCVHIICK